ncbi:MAG: hypothetical protein C0500_11415 [Sphingobium sp.]|jgi:hypothetical protein|nr:hypothetical protein [Sphingobium sp.]
MSAQFGKPPLWFWVVSAVLFLWACMGLFAFYSQVLDSAGIASLPDYDRQLLTLMPMWLNAVYAIAVLSGALGGVLLLARSAHARLLFLVSLVSVIVQFGYTLGATDLIAVKGLLVAAGFPVFIIAMGVVQLWFARLATGRGWLR